MKPGAPGAPHVLTSPASGQGSTHSYDSSGSSPFTPRETQGQASVPSLFLPLLPQGKDWKFLRAL